MDNDCFKIDDEHGILTRSLLHEEYIVNRLSDSQIAAKYGIGSKATVWRRRKFHDVANRYVAKSNRNASVNRTVVISAEDAIKMLSEGKTHQEIAGVVGASRMSVFRRLQELGLTTVKKHSQNKLRWHEDLTDKQIVFLLGTLLGDGSLAKGGLFVCNHCAKQKTYISHKMDVIKTILPPNYELAPISGTATKGGCIHHGFQIKTQQNKNLKEMHSIFYPNGTKIFPYEYLSSSSFNEKSLAYWYMDDGSRNGNSAILSTYGFGFAGNAKILAFLKEKFGLIGTLIEDKGKSRSEDARHFIRFSTDEAVKFFTIVSPYIAYGMEYKIPAAYRSQLRLGFPPSSLEQ